MEAKNSKKAQDMDNAVVHAATVRSFRNVPPAHYTLKLSSFSLFLEAEIENYESRVFEAGGYKWFKSKILSRYFRFYFCRSGFVIINARVCSPFVSFRKLSLYPNGNNKMNVKGHISLYLVIVDTETLPPCWEVNVSFKLCVFDQIRDKYVTIQDAEGGVGRFHILKTEWGFDEFLPLETFIDTSEGYLVDDCCAFGADVFVIKHSGKGESVSMVKGPVDNIYTWRIHKFSAINRDVVYSEKFVVSGHKWKLEIHPKGYSSSKVKGLSLFLQLTDCMTLPSDRKVYAAYKLRIRDDVHGNHFQREAGCWFCSSSQSWGYRQFMNLSDLNDPSKGFLVNGVITVEAEIEFISNFKDF